MISYETCESGGLLVGVKDVSCRGGKSDVRSGLEGNGAQGRAVCPVVLCPWAEADMRTIGLRMLDLQTLLEFDLGMIRVTGRGQGEYIKMDYEHILQIQ